jgi:hypothetical protein
VIKFSRLILGGCLSTAYIWACAQQDGFVRVPLQTQDFSYPNKVVVQARAEFESGVTADDIRIPAKRSVMFLKGNWSSK